MKFRNLILSCFLSVALSSCTSNAKNESEFYTVIFNTNGGSSVESQIVEKGSKIVKPNNPTKDDYSFVNWTYQGEEWSFIGYVVTEDMTLDANWAENSRQFLINYDLDGGFENTYCSLPHSYYTLSGLDFFGIYNDFPPMKYNYKFVCFKDEENNEITSIPKGTARSITLKAVWELADFELQVKSVDENKGTVVYPNNIKMLTPTKLEACPCDGYYFDGWYLNYDSEYSKFLFSDTVFTYSLDFISLYEGVDEIFVKQIWTDVLKNGFKLKIVANFISIEEYEDKQKGTLPNFDFVTSTLTYGIFPQSHVNDSELINSLNMLKDEDKNSGYYLFNNDYYTYLIGDPFEDNYKFDDGTAIEKGAKYWFKCEPIKWTFHIRDRNLWQCETKEILFGVTYNSSVSYSNYIKEQCRIFIDQTYINYESVSNTTNSQYFNDEETWDYRKKATDYARASHIECDNTSYYANYLATDIFNRYSRYSPIEIKSNNDTNNLITDNSIYGMAVQLDLNYKLFDSPF